MFRIGIDLGGTKIALGILNAQNQLLAETQIATLPRRPLADVMARMAQTAQAMMQQAGVKKDDVQGVGIGVPSSVHPQTGQLIFANNLGWRMADIRGAFQAQARWELPVFTANDADCAALAEACLGAGSAFQSMFFVTLGTGFGGSFVQNRRLFLGGDGYGIEPGHSMFVHGGRRCTCGKQGCLEAYASATALLNDAKAALQQHPGGMLWELCGRNPEALNGRIIFAASGQGDETAQAVIQQYAANLGAGIASLITLFRPQAVVVGGGLSGAGDALFGPLRSAAAGLIYAHDILPVPEILPATLGNCAGMYGAALLCGTET